MNKLYALILSVIVLIIAGHQSKAQTTAQDQTTISRKMDNNQPGAGITGEEETRPVTSKTSPTVITDEDRKIAFQFLRTGKPLPPGFDLSRFVPDYIPSTGPEAIPTGKQWVEDQE